MSLFGPPPERLAGEIESLLDAIRGLGNGRYACLLGVRGVLFESSEPEDRESWSLRRLLEERAKALFAVPQALATDGPLDDVFAGWDHDELFVAIVNGKAAVVVACPEAEPLREKALGPLKALVDRLFRYDQTYRVDPQGRGFFFGQPRLDLLVIGRGGDA